MQLSFHLTRKYSRIVWDRRLWTWAGSMVVGAAPISFYPSNCSIDKLTFAHLPCQNLWLAVKPLLWVVSGTEKNSKRWELERAPPLRGQNCVRWDAKSVPPWNAVRFVRDLAETRSLNDCARSRNLSSDWNESSWATAEWRTWLLLWCTMVVPDALVHHGGALMHWWCQSCHKF